MTLDLFLDKLKEKLNSQKLKGIESHIKMSPKLGEQPYRELVPQGKTKKSSVLLLLIGRSLEELQILFTLRSSNVQHHKRQISFPGGHCEEGEDFVTTAFRESKEEIGLDPLKVILIGKLSPLYVPPSKTVVTPVVGFTNNLPNLIVNNQEVEEIILFPMLYFLDKKNIVVEKWYWNGNLIDVPLWKIHKSVPLWGATAMIMSEFIDIVNEILK
ncbi:MAG: CoA pyrophosphatase [Ignavibacteria bacterium]|nr:CoA pyrophosphatase [Ignavibacteria bacterium]